MLRTAFSAHTAACRATQHLKPLHVRLMSQRSVVSKLARNKKKAAMHDRNEGLNNIEENYLMQQEQRSELAREAEQHHRQQQLPGTGTMLLHYFLAGIGVTVGFIIIGVAMRAVGLEHDALEGHAEGSTVLALEALAPEPEEVADTATQARA